PRRRLRRGAGRTRSRAGVAGRTAQGQLRACIRRDELLVGGPPHRRQRDAADTPRPVARVLDASVISADALPGARAFGGERTCRRGTARRRPPPPAQSAAWVAAVLTPQATLNRATDRVFGFSLTAISISRPNNSRNRSR